MRASNKRLAKNTIFLFIRMLLVMGVTLFTSRIVLNILGFTDYGVYGVIGGIVAIFGFLNGAMSGASSRFLSYAIGEKDNVKLNKTFNVLLASHAAIALCVILLCETAGLWLLYHKLVLPPDQMRIIFWVFQISIISSALSIIVVPFSGVLISYEDLNIYAYVGLGEAILKLGAAYMLYIIPGSKLLIYAILILIIQISVNSFYIIYCLRKYNSCYLNPCPDRALYKEIFGFVGSDLIGNISVLAQGQGLNILLNIFFGPVVNAARGIAYQVQGAVQQFSNNITTAMRPQVIKLCAEREYTEMFRLVERGSCACFYLMWLLILPILLNSQYILTLWLGKYPEYTIPFINIILWISMANSLKTPRTMVFHGLGKIKLVNLVIGGMLIMTFPIAYLALKSGQPPTSVFYISLAIVMLTEFISVAILKKYIRFSVSGYLLHVHGRCALVVAVSCVIPYIWNQHHLTTSFGGFCLAVLISTFSIGATIYAIGFDKGVRDSLTSIVTRHFNHSV